MSHPFEVDKTYRNRIGEYEVVAIDGDRMKIRYVGGGTLDTRTSLQARIWENIQFEEQMAREEERKRLAREARLEARRRAARAKRAAARPKFEGFQESGFEPQQRGLAWKNRQVLGRVLAYELEQRKKSKFGHWIVPRQSKVHVAYKDLYDRETRDQNAAFFVAVDEEGVSFGFCIAKPDGEAEPAWPWSALVAILAQDEETRTALHLAMGEHELTLVIYAMQVSYGPVSHIVAQGEGFLLQQETAEQELTREMTGEELAEYLQAVAPDKRSELFVRKQITPGDALKAGAGVAKEITDVLEALVPLLDASVGA